MKFTKMHGAGNDFVVINNSSLSISADRYSEIAAGLCSRRLSAGADGCMFVEPSDIADFKMVFYNSDGTMGEMCGNGARCIARYGHDKGLSGDIQKIETTAGIVIGEKIDNINYRVKLNNPSVCDIHRTVYINGNEYDCGYVELGNPGVPHGILQLPDWKSVPESELREFGRALRFAKEFPKGANISFVDKCEDGTVDAITFERGVEDFTLACGTGCGSIALILTLRGEVQSDETIINMPGGTLRVKLAFNGSTVSDIYLTGPTCTVYEAETDLF